MTIRPTDGIARADLSQLTSGNIQDKVDNLCRLLEKKGTGYLWTDLEPPGRVRVIRLGKLADEGLYYVEEIIVNKREIPHKASRARYYFKIEGGKKKAVSKEHIEFHGLKKFATKEDHEIAQAVKYTALKNKEDKEITTWGKLLFKNPYCEQIFQEMELAMKGEHPDVEEQPVSAAEAGKPTLPSETEGQPATPSDVAKKAGEKTKYRTVDVPRETWETNGSGKISTGVSTKDTAAIPANWEEAPIPTLGGTRFCNPDNIIEQISDYDNPTGNNPVDIIDKHVEYLKEAYKNFGLELVEKQENPVCDDYTSPTGITYSKAAAGQAFLFKDADGNKYRAVLYSLYLPPHGIGGIVVPPVKRLLVSIRKEEPVTKDVKPRETTDPDRALDEYLNSKRSKPEYTPSLGEKADSAIKALKDEITKLSEQVESQQSES